MQELMQKKNTWQLQPGVIKVFADRDRTKDSRWQSFAIVRKYWRIRLLGPEFFC